ncbi:MAG: PilZ domain-containing protein [Deltaproteobacteria bacterium]|nr:PilZ domain-containing protein [Deltaproteobacteria bacterium]
MSASDSHERRVHFRGTPRSGKRVEVEYAEGDGAPVRACTRNLGVGGAFIVTDRPPPKGTILNVILHVPTATEPIRIKAEVRWHMPSGGTQPGGMGVKFSGLEVDDLLHLNEYFASLTGSDE